MIQQETREQATTKAQGTVAARKPYTPPTIETLGGVLTTLLASGCQCAVCPPDPGADSV